MENRLENVLPFEDDTRTCGKIVGSIGVLFNIFGLILLFCYGATILSIILSLIFWIFGKFYFVSTNNSNENVSDRVQHQNAFLFGTL